MYIGLQWRGMLEGGGTLGNAVLKELESLIASVSAWSNVEHNDDGTHTDVTATSVAITAGAIAYALRVVSGITELNGAVNLPGVVTPEQITSDQNNYAPTGYDSTFCLRLSTDTTRSMTGILLPATKGAGRLLFLVNVGSNDLTLVHESASSDEANRFNFSGSADVTLSPLSTLLLYYDPTAERWLALGGSGSGGGTTPHDLLSVTHPDTTPAAPTAGAIIVAEQTISGGVDPLKYWADGEPYGAGSTTNDPGGMGYWIDGTPGRHLPPTVSAGDVKWVKKPVGSVGDVLTLVFEDGQIKPEWQAGGGSSGSGSSQGAKAYRSTDLTGIVSGVATSIPLSATEFDTGGLWAAGAPTGFTIVEDGLYALVAQVSYPTIFGRIYTRLSVNGTLKAEMQGGGENVSVRSPQQVSAILDLNAGDFVELSTEIHRSSGASPSVQGGSNTTWLAIAKITGASSSGGGSSILPIDLSSSNVTGVLPITNGGTGLSSPGADGTFVKTSGGIFVPSTIAETDIADGTVLARLAANETVAGTYDFTPGLKERGRSTKMGEWISVAYNAANFTASGAMTWTVDAGDQITFAYTLIGTTMILTFHIGTSSVGGVVSTALRIAIPGGFTAVKTMRQPTAIQDNGTRGIGFVQCVAAVPYLECYKPDLSNWTASANNTGLTGQLSFEVS